MIKNFNLETFLRRYWPEVVVLLVIAWLLFWRLGRAAMMADDSPFSFRSIGLVDFLYSANQTTPWQWFNPLPWWVNLSFHDAPPLAFWIQHTFFKIFGVSTWVARFPSALAGLASAGLLYAAIRRKLGRKQGIIAIIALLPLTSFFWLHQMAYFEPMMMPFIVASIYFFWRAEDDNRWYTAWGLALGLALLTKYTALFVVPVYVIYLALFDRQQFKNWKLWRSVILVIIVLSPVIFYNAAMYLTRGHGDVQVSAFLGLTNADWPLLNTEINKNIIAGLTGALVNIRSLLSWPLFILTGLGIIFSCWRVSKKTADLHYHTFVLLSVFFWLSLMTLTKHDARFVATGYIFVPLFLAPFVGWVWELRNLFVRVALLLIFCGSGLWGLWYNYNTNYAWSAQGQSDTSFSQFRREDAGLDRVEQTFGRIFRGKIPGTTLQDGFYRSFDQAYARKRIFDFDSYNKLQNKPIEDGLYIYDQNINWFAEMWYFKRWFFYDRFLVISSRDLVSIRTGGLPFYQQLTRGKAGTYFSWTNENLLDSPKYRTEVDKQLEGELTASTTQQQIIKNKAGQDEIKVFIGKFQ